MGENRIANDARMSLKMVEDFGWHQTGFQSEYFEEFSHDACFTYEANKFIFYLFKGFLYSPITDA